MNPTTTNFSNPNRNLRTVVHAGPLLLDGTSGANSLERYLSRSRRGEVFLVHHGQPELRGAAHEAGVQDIKVDEADAQPEAEAAAHMALALGAHELEYTIDRPALKTVTGTPIQEITAHEAEVFARDVSIRRPIRNKIRAACRALQRGLQRVRIGSPSALARNRATVIVPDPPTALGAELVPKTSPDRDATGPAPDPETHPIELPRPQPPTPIPALARRRTLRRSVRFAPQVGCDIGPRTREPFPMDHFRPRWFDDRRPSRARRVA